MDDFVCDKLMEWSLKEHIPKFQEKKVNKESFLCLEDDNLKELIKEVGPKARFRKLLRGLKASLSATASTSSTSTRTSPSSASNSTSAAGSLSRASTSGASGKRKRDDPGSMQSPKKRHKRNQLERSLKPAKQIMSCVKDKLSADNDVLITFIRELIEKLETDMNESVGVFGRTGVGKSSLINAIIGETVLPTGKYRACTSAIIKVTANTESQKYVANVEFIPQEELEELLRSTKNLFRGNPENSCKLDEESKESSGKMTALFGDKWKTFTYEQFSESKEYKNMRNHIKETKHISCDSSDKLLEKLGVYTRNIAQGPAYWPVVKCVTVKVPNNDLLRHVTLVDLPGAGDRNKTRDDMWKEEVSKCGTVWVVTDNMTRIESDKETWGILEKACSFLGNGGECRKIHFICNKADEERNKLSPVDMTTLKEDIKKEFQRLPEVENHFEKSCLSVFIVSATDANISPGQNEISELEDDFQIENDQVNPAERYLLDAMACLSLMKGARSQNVTQKTAVYNELCERQKHELKEMQIKMKEVFETFKKCLQGGVEKTKREWEPALDKLFKTERSFSKMSSILRYGGIQRTKTGDHVNLNRTLSSFLTQSIDQEFKKTFPNSGKDGPIFESIYTFSLDTESLIENNKDVELLIHFLNREVEKLKERLSKDIRKQKKKIYNSLTETVTKHMLDGYKEAGTKHSLSGVEQALKDHIKTNIQMFENAKNEMLQQLLTLVVYIPCEINKHMDRAMEMSLKRTDMSVPDVSQQFEALKKFHLQQTLPNSSLKMRSL